KGATGVPHPVFRVATAYGVCNPTRRTLDECVLALDAIAADKIGAMPDFSEQFWNVGRVILKIAVNDDHSPATRCCEAGINGGALSGISLETNQADIRRSFDPFRRAIDRSVIDKNDFVIESAQRSAQLFLQNRQVRFLVVKR